MKRSRRVVGTAVFVGLLGVPGVHAQRRIIAPKSPGNPGPMFQVDTLWMIGGSEDRGGFSFGAIGNVAADSAGRILIVDPRLQVVHVADSQGNSLGTLGRSGNGPGEFRLPTRVAVSPDQHVFVFDQYSSRITELDSDLKFVRTVQPQSMIIARTFAVRANDVVISGAIDGPEEARTAAIHVLDRKSGKLRESLGSLRVSQSAELARQAGAGPLWVNADGSFWYAVPGPYVIERYDDDGRLILSIERPSVALPPAEAAFRATNDRGRITTRFTPGPVVGKVLQTSGRYLLHQIALPNGKRTTDVYALENVPDGLQAMLVASWTDRMPILSAELRPGVFLAVTFDKNQAQGVALLRLRPR